MASLSARISDTSNHQMWAERGCFYFGLSTNPTKWNGMLRYFLYFKYSFSYDRIKLIITKRIKFYFLLHQKILYFNFIYIYESYGKIKDVRFVQLKFNIKKKEKNLFQVKFVQKTRRRLRAINVKAIKARRRITCAKVNRLFVILIARIFIHLSY